MLNKISPTLQTVIHFLNSKQDRPWFPESSEWTELDPHHFIIPFWNIDYEIVLKLQHALRDFILLEPLLHFHLVGNHPACLTMGRGLQKEEGHILTQPPVPLNFPIPIHAIERGGGLTFHFPGQWIWYHVAKLHPDRWPMTRHLQHMLQSTASMIQETFELTVTPKRFPLGLWHQNWKVASVGVGITRHITTHGIALNVSWEGIDRDLLKVLSPCGLSHDTYRSLADFSSKAYSPRDLTPLMRKYFMNFTEVSAFN